MRRLVIAAALTLDVGELARAKLAPARRRPAHRHRLCRPSFCVLSIHGGGVEGAGRSASSQSKAARGATGVRPYGHIPFPADPLLALGEPRQRRQRAPGPRRRNPLDRWVRPSRQDPDYRPRGRADGEAGEAFGSPLLAGSQPSRHRARRTRPAPPAPLSADPMESLRDWRRVYDEWEKIIPASAFAARIHALQRVIADPEALIARTAQRLRQIRDRVAALVKDALPLLRQPRRDRTAPSRETNFLAARCHGAIFHPDTS